MKQAYYASAAQAKDENSLPRPQRMRHASHIHTAASAHHHSLNSIKESVTCTVLRRWRAYAASLLSACLQSLLDDVDGRESHTSHHLHVREGISVPARPNFARRHGTACVLISLSPWHCTLGNSGRMRACKAPSIDCTAWQLCWEDMCRGRASTVHMHDTVTVIMKTDA